MNWSQYWALQWMDFEVSMAVIGALLALTAICFAGYLVYDKIQDWRGK
jgi:hypothetical protein